MYIEPSQNVVLISRIIPREPDGSSPAPTRQQHSRIGWKRAKNGARGYVVCTRNDMQIGHPRRSWNCHRFVQTRASKVLPLASRKSTYGVKDESLRFNWVKRDARNRTDRTDKKFDCELARMRLIYHVFVQQMEKSDLPSTRTYAYAKKKYNLISTDSRWLSRASSTFPRLTRKWLTSGPCTNLIERIKC